jgi:hypothetical protein
LTFFENYIQNIEKMLIFSLSGQKKAKIFPNGAKKSKISLNGAKKPFWS